MEVEGGLRPAACRSTSSAGRRWPEEPDPFRTAYQRDRDRIIHSSAFRRLQYKTQVFINHEGDHYRTRLTHTLEVAQIARTIARTLRLNEDLTEAVALAHDLGHTPFGHAGEEVLDRLMRNHGGFEHNIQSFRIVDELERAYPEFPGLNLTRESRHGVFAHSSRTGFVPDDLRDLGPPPLEAQVADVADEIAYSAHDMEDGLSSGLIGVSDLEAAALFRRHWPGSFEKGQNYGRVKVRTLLRRVIADLVIALVEETERRIRKAGIEESDGDGAETPASGSPVVELPPRHDGELRELKAILHERLYRHPRVADTTEAETRRLPDLFHHYLERPDDLPAHFRERIGRSSRERVVCDYIAGMTDRFATWDHQRRCGGSGAR
ncbi:MAG: deoxyguanosinetriphosphate triphosphohydrolase [Acidobacteriota bacterium]|nr:deoxyguanosinetriphosphate triphosphohydrolase [Acidobacteriota bacterium]